MAASQESSLSWTSQSFVITTGITNITVTKANKEDMEITIFTTIIGIKGIMDIIIGVADFKSSTYAWLMYPPHDGVFICSFFVCIVNTVC
jgi:hypothetical protein